MAISTATNDLQFLLSNALSPFYDRGNVDRGFDLWVRDMRVDSIYMGTEQSFDLLLIDMVLLFCQINDRLFDMTNISLHAALAINVNPAIRLLQNKT